MAALTAARNTPEIPGHQVSDPVAAATTIYAGALVALDASGNLVPGAVATTLTARGRAAETVDNSAGAAGDRECPVDVGVFRFANHATDTIDRTHIGGTAYIADDQTVAATDGTATRSAAGRIVQVDAVGVWVEIQ